MKFLPKIQNFLVNFGFFLIKDPGNTRHELEKPEDSQNN